MDIGSKRIPFWINRKKHQMHVVRVVGPFQPFQGRIVLNQPEVHQGYRVWRDVSFARNSFQCAQHFVDFSRFFQLRADVPPNSYRLAVSPAEAPRTV
jgi:hypothetical protein